MRLPRIMTNPGLLIALLALVPAATAAKTAGAAQAEQPSSGNASFTTVDGRLARYLESLDGKIDGVVLEDGTVARFAPRRRAFETTPLRKGDPVQVHGEVVCGLPGPYLVHASLSRGDALLRSAGLPLSPHGELPAASAPAAGPKPSAGIRTHADDVLIVESPQFGPHKRSRLKTVERKLRHLTTGVPRNAVNSQWSRRREDEGP